MYANKLTLYTETPKDPTQKLNKTNRWNGVTKGQTRRSDWAELKVAGYKLIYKYLSHFFKQKVKYNKIKKKQFHLSHVKKMIYLTKDVKDIHIENCKELTKETENNTKKIENDMKISLAIELEELI